MSDPFTGPHTGRDHPDTSFAAAEKIRPALPTIRAQVLAFAREAGAADADSGGFIDEDLSALVDADDPLKLDRSIRPRRRELTEENYIVETSFRRQNAQGNDCVVWVHRDHHPAPPPIVSKPERVRIGELRRRAEDAAATVERWGRQMHSEGRLYAHELTDAARTIRELLKA